MRKVCLLDRGSVGSEITRDINKNNLSTKEESIYTISFSKDSLPLKRLFSVKLKSVKFRIVEKWNLSFWYDDRLSWISAVKLNISKN